MRDSYPSDISREQFESIEFLFKQAKKKTKPRVVELYDVSALFCMYWRVATNDEFYPMISRNGR